MNDLERSTTSQSLWIAIMQMVGKVGIDATLAFLNNRGATIDDAIAALEKARDRSLEDIIAEDAASTLAKASAASKLEAPPETV